MDTWVARVGMGAVVRNHEGRVLAMQCLTRPLISNPTTAKTIAAWQAMELGIHMGVANLELEGDAMEVVRALNAAGPPWGRDCSVLSDIKLHLRNFHTRQVSHVNRGANGVAHSLARMAMLLGV